MTSSPAFCSIRLGKEKNLAFWWCPSLPRTLSWLKGYSSIEKGFIFLKENRRGAPPIVLLLIFYYLQLLKTRFKTQKKLTKKGLHIGF
jgi:hypothetical protein